MFSDPSDLSVVNPLGSVINIVLVIISGNLGLSLVLVHVIPLSLYPVTHTENLSHSVTQYLSNPL
jgi:hypothetical protein